MSLEKRIKRHIIGTRHRLYAVTLPGYETVCRREVAGLSDTIETVEVSKGGVAFSGRLIDIYRANLNLRTAVRILIRLTAFKATNFQQLQRRTAAVDWSLWLPSGVVPQCHVTAHHSRLYHSGAIADRITGQVSAHWVENGISPVETLEQALYVRLQNDHATFSLDSSGAHLYRRGLKTHNAEAPLRETMAAAILKKAGYRPHRPLVDPMCGAGTFSLEAALMAKGIPPGLKRGFAFQQWPAYRPRQWAHLTQSAGRDIKAMQRPLIWASDVSAAACRQLTATVAQHRLQDGVSVSREDFFDLDAAKFGDETGLVVLNPPYGRRLAPGTRVNGFYQRIVAKLKDDFKGWQVALIAPQAPWTRKLPLNLDALPLDHGGLKLTLFFGRI